MEQNVQLSRSSAPIPCDEELEQCYRQFFRTCNDAVFIVDVDSEMILDVNPQACTMLGYDRDELLSLSITTIHPSEMDQVKAFTQAVRTQGHAWTNELQCLAKDGRRVPAEMSAALLPINGRTLIVGFVRDIGERKRAETELAEYRNHLEELVRERTRQLEAANAELRALQERLRQENAYLRDEVRGELAGPSVVVRSAALRHVFTQASAVAETDASVLIRGETGVGKELVARHIHEHSRRSEGPLIKVNCGSVPKELFESEFFGHVKGAFTGASSGRIGRFELAHSGTLFLDEVGEIPPESQSKLLRVLQEGLLERIGDPSPRHIDVRVIAATNRDLETAIDGGAFRQDLYYRINVFPIGVPPLRERPEDIAPLAEQFLNGACRRLGCQPATLSEEDLQAMRAYDWPGNVRELHNVIERGLILARGGALNLAPLLRDAQNTGPQSDSGSREEAATPGITTYARLRELEKKGIVHALEAANGKISGRNGAAERLGIKPTTLRSRMDSFGISRESAQTSGG